jgi:hypothetical protein
MPMNTTAPAVAVRAMPPRSWSYFAPTGLLTLVDAPGWPETWRQLALDVARTAFELVAAGERFGESLVVLVDGSATLCSCPDGDGHCRHGVAVAALVRTWRRRS